MLVTLLGCLRILVKIASEQHLFIMDLTVALRDVMGQKDVMLLRDLLPGLISLIIIPVKDARDIPYIINIFNKRKRGQPRDIISMGFTRRNDMYVARAFECEKPPSPAAVTRHFVFR